MRKISPPPGFDTPFVQLAASRYIDWVIAVHIVHTIRFITAVLFFTFYLKSSWSFTSTAWARRTLHGNLWNELKVCDGSEMWIIIHSNLPAVFWSELHSLLDRKCCGANNWMENGGNTRLVPSWVTVATYKIPNARTHTQYFSVTYWQFASW